MMESGKRDGKTIKPLDRVIKRYCSVIRLVHITW